MQENKGKPFYTYSQLIGKLINKGMVINGKQEIEHATDLLKRYGYFSLISGYKRPFKKHKSDMYIVGVKIDDIYALYKLDNDLRNLFFRYILQVECHIKSLLSYAFSDKYGEEQENYLDPNKYNYSVTTQREIVKLVTTLTDITDSQKTNYEYIRYQYEKYGNVPLWVAIKALSIGKISKLYSLSKPNIRTKVSKEFSGVTDDDLKSMLDIISRFRNVCAHNERLYDFVYKKSSLNNMSVHKLMNLKTVGGKYVIGKSDLFAVVISLKYLLPHNDFSCFIDELQQCLKTFKSDTSKLPLDKLRKLMNFPENWYELKTLSLNTSSNPDKKILVTN